MIPNLKKGHWDADETESLKRLVLQQQQNLIVGGAIDWEAVCRQIPGRTGKACRERWISRVDPSINRSPFNAEEEDKLMRLHEQFHNQWAKIAQEMPGRTADAVKSKHISIMRRRQRDLGHPRVGSLQRKRKETGFSSGDESPPKRHLSPVSSSLETSLASLLSFAQLPSQESFDSALSTQVAEDGCVTDMVCRVLGSQEFQAEGVLQHNASPRGNRKPAHSLDLGEDLGLTDWLGDSAGFMHSSMSPTAAPTMVAPAVKEEGGRLSDTNKRSFLGMLTGKAIEPLLLSDDAPASHSSGPCAVKLEKTRQQCP